MTWEEFKKKKKQEEANKENTKTTNNSTSQMSSWQKYKQERELKSSQNSSWEEFKKKKKQEEANKENTKTTNNSTSQMSSWQKYKQERKIKSSQNSSWEKFKQEKTNHNQDETEEENTWFKNSELFSDGYQFGDVTKTALSTIGDIGVNVVKGAAGLGEGIADVISYAGADIYDLMGNDSKADAIRKRTQENTIESIFSPVDNYLDEKSVLGEKSDSIAQALGYIAGNTAVSVLTGGAGGALGASTTVAGTLGSTATIFTSTMGNSMSEALKDGATIDEARMYGAVSGAGEAASELMFGGLGKASSALGLSKGALDDVVVSGLTKNIKNKMVKTIMQSGIKATGEGLEEVVSGLISAVGKKATYMKEKDIKEVIENEDLAEQFWMGALTSAIAQAPSTIKSVGNGTDYITGRTNNEQKVYDNEVKERVNERIRQTTIEQAYKEQIKSQENLGIEITEDLKNQIMQKVENAYDNGTLKSIELNRKDKLEIEDQVEKDMQDGNISAENIMKTLGENQDISKDNLLMRSMYENEQKYNSYQVEQTDNEKVNILLQSAADAGMNNTRKTRRKIELISKLVQDTDRQYKFVSPENLKEMGYNENANGLIDKSTGEILINAHSEKGLQSIVGHETTHIFDNKDSKGTYTKEYQTLQDMTIEYAKTKGIYDSKVKSITDAYGNLLVDENQIKEELTADLVGDFLFNDEKFIENLSIKDKNVFQKIYDYIKHIYKVATAGTEEAKAIENLKYQFDKVYKSINNKQSNGSGIKYSFAGKKGMENAVVQDSQNIELEKLYNKAHQMEKANIDNETIRQNTNWFQDKNGDWKFEFSDKDMSLKRNIELKENTIYKLSDILKHDTLFILYPQLADYKIEFKDLNNKGGKFNKETNKIEINSKKLNSKNYKTSIEGTLIHEIQHAIQNIEGFENGTSTKGSKLAYYENLGEIEAADVKERFIIEKEGILDINKIAPESSKNNPKHKNLNKYLNNRGIIDKVKDGIYNYFKSKSGDDNYEIDTQDMEHVNEEISEDILQKNREVREEIWNRRSRRRYLNENSNESSFSLQNDNIKLQLTNDTKITGDDIAVKDLLKEERPNIEEEVGNNVLSDSNINTETNTTVEDIVTQTEEQKQQGMKDKAKKYLSRSKTKFINKIVDDFGTSKIANTKTLNSVVDKIREDIRQNGKLTKEKTDKYFNELYDNLVKIDTLYYDTYKDLKDNLKSTKLYISDSIKNNITDFADFKKSNMGSLLMTSDSNNMPVDTYYQELSDLYPELFPQDIINPADQLNKMAEVSKDISKVETNVAAYNDKYLGPDYRSWARELFDKDVNDFMQDIKLANRYNEASNENIKIGVDKEIIKEAYRELPNARKKYEKAMAKELLTKEDRLQVDRLLNNEIGPQDIPVGYNKKGILKIAEAKLEYDSLQKAIKEYQKDIKTNRIEQAKTDVGNLELWKDKKYGFQYSRETPIRNIYDIAPKDIADNIVDKYFRSYIEINEKKVIDAINGYNDRIKQLGIETKNKYEIQYIETQLDQNNIENKPVTKKVSESALVQLLGEKKITTEDIVKSGADLNKIQNAVNEFRNIYNELIEQINESMLDNGYAPVEYRKDYFPHFTEEKADTLLGKAAKLLGINITNREELPTDIAGQTYQFKPGKTWFSNILQRVTDVTDYDVLKGFDKYIRGATDLIYHTGDIQNLRALSTAIRGTYNDVEIQNKIEEIKESTMSELDKANAIQEIYNAAKDKSHLSKFIEWLDNYTNLLAGKKAINDRGTEKELNRQIYKTMQDIESRISANAIGGNIGVSLTNFSPLSQAWGEIKTTNLINGIWQTMKASLGKDSSFASESQFLTRRRGTEHLSETTLDKVTKPINNLLQFADDFTSEVIVRARYNQNLQNGMNSEYALEEADRYTASLMADRGRGALPTQFSNKNPISKMINMFQVEVNNQWSYYLKDLPKNIQNKANNNKTKVIAETALAYTKIMVGAYLTNELLGSIRGNSTRVLPDPIYIIKELIKGLSDDDDENDDDTIIETMTEIAGNVPFIALPSTLLADSLGLDVGDIGRISISGAIPNVSDITSDIMDIVNEEKTLGEGLKSIGGELLDTVGASLILPYGGSQIKKSIKGLSLYANDIPGSYNDSGDLRYTVDDDVGSKIQATLFGAYANPYAQDYIDSGFKSIKKDNIDEMVGLGMNSSEYRELKEDLNNVSTTTDKNGYKQYVDSNNKVYWYDSDSEIMYDSNYNKTTLTEDDLQKISKTEETLNYINSLDLTNSQKNIIANNLNKNSKKTIDMKQYSNYSSYEEYKYARDYPEKYNVISQITDYNSFEKYKEDIDDIKKQYSSELGYESKDRKNAVQEYINGLDLNIYQKMMLEKMAGGYSIKNYRNYIYEYLESTDLTNSEKYSIWEEIFN